METAQAKGPASEQCSAISRFILTCSNDKEDAQRDEGESRLRSYSRGAATTVTASEPECRRKRLGKYPTYGFIRRTRGVASIIIGSDIRTVKEKMRAHVYPALDTGEQG
eukprot:6202212-Pleurochrysis_carterae.AAC.1